MKPYYADEAVTLYHGDALAVLREIDRGSVDCIVTSPPYYGLRDYGVDGQYGLEPTPAEYVETMRDVFAEARQVLTDDGTLWLNIGDKYGRSQTANVPQTKNKPCAMPTTVQPIGEPKNLLGMPWRVAFALQDDGWTLRNAVVWHKPNAMPESVTDRLSSRYEMLFMLSKSRRYHFDLDAVREPHAASSIAARDAARAHPRAVGKAGTQLVPGARAQSTHAAGLREMHQTGANPGDVWAIPTQPFAEAHFACMPVALAERCIRTSKPGCVVLDPFSGSGTTGLAAGKLGRRYVGIDLNRGYLDLSLQSRLAQAALLDGAAS